MRGFLVIALLVALVAGIAYLLMHFINKRKADKTYAESIEGKINKQIKILNLEREDTELEITHIDSNINDVRQEIEKDQHIPPSTLQQSRQLIDAFQQQKQLRQSKIAFYITAIKKLQTLLQNHKIQQQLTEKQNTLRELRDDHHEAVASMEEIRSNLAYQQSYVESIDRLSLRMLDTDNPDDVEGLNLELKKITEEIDRM